MATTPTAVNGSAARVGVLNIDRIKTETVRVPIVGSTPLLMNRFSEKAKRQMLAAMQGQKALKERKDPEAEYTAALYMLNETEYGFPAIGFKSAIVGAARFFSQVKMTELRQFLFVKGVVGVDGKALIKIEGTPVMQEDVVTVGRGSDLRYRPLFADWGAKLDIEYVTSALTRDSVVSLVDAAGLGVGVGEWRPQKGGDFGMFSVAQDQNVEVIS